MLQATKILNNLLHYAESGMIEDNMYQSLLETSAVIQGRLFNSEQGTKDSKGKSLGGYSRQYAVYRASLGHQAIKKDLEVTGDLRRSIEAERVGRGGRIYFNDSISYPKIGKSKNVQSKPVQAIRNIDKAKHIQTYQSKQGNDKIWVANKNEREYFYNKVRTLIYEDLQQLIQRQ